LYSKNNQKTKEKESKNRTLQTLLLFYHTHIQINQCESHMKNESITRARTRPKMVIKENTDHEQR